MWLILAVWCALQELPVSLHLAEEELIQIDIAVADLRDRLAATPDHNQTLLPAAATFGIRRHEQKTRSISVWAEDLRQ